ncbi:MAG: peptidase S8, partial [Burkholderiales bacterium PBB5]
ANSGSWVMLAAPGDASTSSVPGGGYATWGGTSMAAPLVAGTAALALALRPDTPPQDLARCLLQTTQALSGTALRQLDAAAALQLLALDPSRCR